MTNLITFVGINIIEIIIFMILIITGLVVIRIYYGDPKPNNNPDENESVKKIVTIESLKNKSDDEKHTTKVGNKLTDILMGKKIGPCHDTTYSKDEVHKYCSKYFNEKDNCTANSCCVWLNDKECVGGDRHGPIYLSTDKKPINVEYYHFKNDCYGGTKEC